MMQELTSNPSFGILLTIICYELGKLFYKKFKHNAFLNIIFNPILIATILIIAVLVIFKISFQNYNQGGKMITFVLGPATVALAHPLYRKIDLLKKHFLAILAGIIGGSFASVTCVLILCKLFHFDRIITISTFSKSITTPIGISITNSYNGEVSITILAIIITGMTGAIFAPAILKIFRIKNNIAKGVAIGTASHAVGTSKAIEIGEIEGAMSGLAIGLAGLSTVFIIPIIIKLFL